MFSQIAKKYRQVLATWTRNNVKDKDLIKYRAPENRLIMTMASRSKDKALIQYTAPQRSLVTPTAMVGGIVTKYQPPLSSLKKFTPPSSHLGFSLIRFT